MVSSHSDFQCIDVSTQMITTDPNYESILHTSFVSMFQIVSLDSWAEAMRRVMDVEGYLAEVFYFLMVIILPTYCSKLFVAQIIDSYQIVMGMQLTHKARTLPAIIRLQYPTLVRAFEQLRSFAAERIAEHEAELQSRLFSIEPPHHNYTILSTSRDLYRSESLLAAFVNGSCGNCQVRSATSRFAKRSHCSATDVS